MSEISNTQVDGTQDIAIVMPMYNLIEYSNIYSETSRSSWKCYSYEPALDHNNKITDFLIITIIVFRSSLIANNRANKKRWHEKRWNNVPIKISK